MKKTEPKRTNVQVLRSTRDRLNRTFERMSSEELLNYFATRRISGAKAVRRPMALRSRTKVTKAKVLSFLTAVDVWHRRVLRHPERDQGLSIGCARARRSASARGGTHGLRCVAHVGESVDESIPLKRILYPDPHWKQKLLSTPLQRRTLPGPGAVRVCDTRNELIFQGVDILEGLIMEVPLRAGPPVALLR